MTIDGELTAISARIEELILRLESGEDSAVRRDAVELARLILAMHGAGLARMLEVMRAQKGGSTLVNTLAADPSVATLLSLHDLHPHAAEEPALVPLTRRAPERAHDDAEHCDRCGTALAPAHPHVVDLESRRLTCTCERCWQAVGGDASGARQRAVPRQSAPRPPLRLSAAEWDALQVPVGVAFFMVNSTIGRVLAFYPSPAGAVESLLPLQAWRDVVDANPWVEAVSPDVEALLVRKERDGSFASTVMPIDACYELVGRLRLDWSGFDGGDAVRREIGRVITDGARGEGQPLAGAGA